MSAGKIYFDPDGIENSDIPVDKSHIHAFIDYNIATSEDNPNVIGDVLTEGVSTNLGNTQQGENNDNFIMLSFVAVLAFVLLFE
jgi:hypothetical protein